MTNKYSSKVDLWLVCLLGGLTALFAWGAWQSSAWAGYAVLFSWVAGVAITMIPCYYVLEEDYLLIRGGVWKWRIPYSDIQSITPSKSLLAGPALSLDRLELRSGQSGSILISPADREAFLAELKQRRQG